MRSKVIFGHPKWPPAAILSQIKKKVPYRSEEPEMRSKVNFGHPKWRPVKNFRKIKNPYHFKWAEMLSKAIFRTSKKKSEIKLEVNDVTNAFNYTIKPAFKGYCHT